VVVALRLEGDREAVAEIEYAGVLARPLEDSRTGARQALQERRGVLVAAMLRPEKGEDGELEVVRLALQQFPDTSVLPVREAELAVEWLFRDGAQTASLAGRPEVPGGSREGWMVRVGLTASPRGGVYPPQAVTRRDTLLLLLLSAIWGSSFLFIKLGVDVLEPSVVVLGRLVFGALFLAMLLPGRGGLGPLRGNLLPLVVLGALNNAVPFWLLGFAETRLPSGLTAVIQASAPIFTVLLASRIDASQRVGGTRLIGVAVGFVGVALLVGVQSGDNLVAAFAVIGVALCYAVSVLYAGRTVRGIPPLQVSLGQLTCAAVLMAPVGIAQLPSSAPGAKVWVAVLALGVLGSGVAYLLYFAIIASAGASRAILVTYLVPAFALVYGVVFLDEAITVTALIGLALILGGTALATGLARVKDR
jgi:drug/metabolite transporter (DMT)-like permease